MTQTLDHHASGDPAARAADVPEISTLAARQRASRPARQALVPEPVPATAPAAAAPAPGRRWWRPGGKDRFPVPAAPAPRTPSRAAAAAAATATAKTVLSAAGLVLALAVAAAGGAYLTFPHAGLFKFAKLHGTTLNALVPAAALAAIIAVAIAWRAARRQLEGRKSADVLTVLAATVAMAVSATGMWAFFGRYVPTVPVLVRIPLFAFLELSTLAMAVRSRDNMRQELARAAMHAEVLADAGVPAEEIARVTGKAGTGLDVDALAMWAFTGVNAFLASLASTTVAEALFRLFPPLIAAWLWERALVSERRRTAPVKREKPAWRISPERILVRLGLLDPAGKTTSEVAAQRRLTVLALAADRVASLKAANVKPGTWRRDRADRQLAAATRKAVTEADLAVNPDRRRQVAAQVAVLRSSHELVELDFVSPWAHLALRQPPAPRQPSAIPQSPAAGQPQREARRPDERPKNSRPEEQKSSRPEERRRPADGDSGLSQLADAAGQALRQKDAARVHELLTEPSVDLAGMVRWLGDNNMFGGKRLMMAAAMYAEPGALASTAKVAAWIAGIVPGKPGTVDKADIRRVRELIEPRWTALNYPGPAAAGGKDDNQE